MNYSRIEGCLIKDTETTLVHLSSIFDSLLNVGTKHSMVLAVNSLHPKGTHPSLQQHPEEVDTEGGLPEMADVVFGQGVQGGEIAGIGGQRPTQGRGCHERTVLEQGSLRLGMPYPGTFWTCS